jgi:hypothetical protein
MQTSEDQTTRWKWVDYAAFDAKATFDLYHSLREKLQATKCIVDNQLVHGLTGNREEYTQWDLYLDIIRPFGDILTCMESVRHSHGSFVLNGALCRRFSVQSGLIGIHVDVQYGHARTHGNDNCSTWCVRA